MDVTSNNFHKKTTTMATFSKSTQVPKTRISLGFIHRKSKVEWYKVQIEGVTFTIPRNIPLMHNH